MKKTPTVCSTSCTCRREKSFWILDVLPLKFAPRYRTRQNLMFIFFKITFEKKSSVHPITQPNRIGQFKIYLLLIGIQEWNNQNIFWTNFLGRVRMWYQFWHGSYFMPPVKKTQFLSEREMHFEDKTNPISLQS